MAKSTFTVSVPAGQPEEWRPVPGYEGIYEVSDCARVRVLPRRFRDGGLHKGRVKVQSLSKGYAFDCLTDQHGNQRTHMIHRLVAAAFLGPLPPGMEVNHKNGNKLDNRPANLEYVSPRDNLLHAYREGLKNADHIRGERNPLAKMNPDRVRQLRGLVAGGLSYTEAGRLFGISRPAAREIARRRTWKHVV